MWFVRALLRSTMLSGIPQTSGLIGPLPFDVNIILISGQSNSEDADAVPIEEEEEDDAVIMLDSVRPRHWDGAFGSSGFTPARGVEYVDASNPPNHWGGNMAVSTGKSLIGLIEQEDGLPYAAHGKRVLVVHIGQSSATPAQFSAGTPTGDRVVEHLTAVKATCVAEGKSVGIIAGAWLHGAKSYELNIGEAAAKTQILDYWQIGGFVDVHLASIFGQQGQEFPVGIVGSAAHGLRGNPIDPFVANAENQLVAEFPRFHMVNGEGQYFYNGAARGYGGSGVHHSAREAALVGATIGWWVKRVVCDGAVWPSMRPTFTRTGPRRVEATFADLPAGYFLSTVGTGLRPLTMQPNYGWCFADPASPTVLLALVRPPYPQGHKLIFDFVADLPANLEVRHGALGANVHAGNYVAGPFLPEATYTVRGVTWPLRRNIPALREAIAA